MASPQKENGYTAIANEIIEAIMKCRLHNEETRVLLCVLRETYGWNRKEAEVSVSGIASMTGLVRQNANRALRNLAERGIIFVITSDSRSRLTVRFNKNYSAWKCESRVIQRESRAIQKKNQVPEIIDEQQQKEDAFESRVIQPDESQVIQNRITGDSKQGPLPIIVKQESNILIPPYNPPMKKSDLTELPPWVDQEAWDGFLEMRKKIKKPLTKRATNLLIGRLSKLRSEGQDPNACLDQSTMNNWQSVYELKDENRSVIKPRNYRECQDAERRAIASAILDSYKGGRNDETDTTK